jgi:glycosyltransferase involved in cell wall biosynthesis
MRGFLSALGRTVGWRSEPCWARPYQGALDVFRVLVVCDRIDPTYHLTFHFPLLHLQDQGIVDFAVLSGNLLRDDSSGLNKAAIFEGLKTDYRPNVMVFSRCGDALALEVMQLAKRTGIPALYYLDDNLIELPSTLGRDVLERHGRREVVETRRKFLAEADAVLTSTHHLGDAMRDLCPGQKVAELLYPPYLGHLVHERRGDDKAQHVLTIGYMGSKGHQHARFETFGTISMPRELRSFGARVRAREGKQDYSEFLDCLYSLGWDIGLAPLQTTAFNLCRSAVKFFEYTACHVATIASDMDVYRPAIDQESGILAGDSQWESALQELARDPGKRRRLVRNAQQRCMAQHALDRVAAKLKETLDIAIR